MDQVSKHQHLHKRNGVWYYRRHVPLDVREAFGKSDIVKSLGASSIREAKHEAHILNVQYDEEFEKKRTSGAPIDESSRQDRYSEVIDADFIYRSETYEKAKKKPLAFFAGKIIDLPDDERFFHLTQENASLEEILAYVFKYDLKQRHRQLQIDLNDICEVRGVGADRGLRQPSRFQHGAPPVAQHPDINLNVLVEAARERS